MTRIEGEERRMTRGWLPQKAFYLHSTMENEWRVKRERMTSTEGGKIMMSGKEGRKEGMASKEGDERRMTCE